MINASHVTKTYGDFTAVNDISFEVEKGEIFAFLGPNGAGKTTTIKMLTTLIPPTSGTITLNGFDVLHEQESARKSFGIVFQESSLDKDLTAYENMHLHAVMYGLKGKERKERIEHLISLVELNDKRDVYVKEFSGGMKRRLEIARGLLHNPDVIFLDEPTLGLDPQTRHLVWDHIKKMNKEEGVTVFLTTHLMEEVERMAERLAVIDKGEIIHNGTPNDLKERTGQNTVEDAFIELTGKALRE